VPRVRIAFFELSPMLTEILQATLAPIAEVELLAGRSRDAPADLMITRAGALAGDEVVTLLYKRPRMRLLTVEELGPQAYLFELRPERTELGELSPTRLVDIVRQTGEAA
jgi:hypothetical protein